MCLIVNIEKTKDLERRMSKGKKIFYKVYKMDREKHCLKSLFYGNGEPIRNGIVQPFSSISKIKTININLNGIEIGRGAIHVFAEKNDAESYVRVRNEVVVKVVCKKEDLIAAGCGGDVAFKKIEISKKDFDSTMNNTGR